MGKLNIGTNNPYFTLENPFFDLRRELFEYQKVKVPKIEKVIFNNPATVVIWSDGTKTIVKCQPGDKYSEEVGLALCISKKYLGNKGNFNEVFKKWIPPVIIPSIGTKIQIIDAGYGALGANGRKGVVTERTHDSGIYASEPGYNVACDGRVWRINSNAKIKILSEKVKEVK